jgi:putative two-component system response regulator
MVSEEDKSMFAQILVVDDDPMIVDVLTRFLSREGYSVLAARNGIEALEKVEQAQPDLILLDVTMPEMDGFTVCRRLKDNEHTALIPITMLTGLDDREHRTRGIESGADDFLTKPFEQSILRARIRSQLRLKRLTDQLEHTENVIFMLAQAVEAKDSYTEGHLRRLRAYGEQLAIACGLGPNDVRAVRYGGILHDIGKIGVREQVLHKNSPLTDEEYRHVMEHPVTGWRTLQPLLRDHAIALNVVRSHHERWDGGGLPDQLSGEKIPLEARIAAVADTFDAMTSHRPYRPQLPIDATLDELIRCRGTQFDPKTVDAFVTLTSRTGLQNIEEA